jgi:hypothetical protein
MILQAGGLTSLDPYYTSWITFHHRHIYYIIVLQIHVVLNLQA